MNVKSQIESAIERSISHNEIVHVTIDGDSGAALAAISELRDESTDYTMSDYEGVNALDIWGYDEGAPEGEMVWRLAIRFGADE